MFRADPIFPQTPLSLQIIANNLISGVYPSMKAFDMDMARLFEKARRYYSRVTPPYGAVLAIQVGPSNFGRNLSI